MLKQEFPLKERSDFDLIRVLVLVFSKLDPVSHQAKRKDLILI